MMQANEVLLKVRTVILWLEKLVSGVIWEAVEERAVFWSGTGQSGEADEEKSLALCTDVSSLKEMIYVAISCINGMT